MGNTDLEKQLTDEEALQNFLLDIDCLEELRAWTGKFNIFDVLKISRTEIRHSNMLSWLLDPTENHGLGDAFLKSVLQRIVKNDKKNRYKVFEVLLMDLNSFAVRREWKHIDLLLVSEKEKCVMAIENKVGSHEHSNQLNRYRESLEKELPDFKRIFVYLTPDGEEPSDSDNWDILTYSEVIEDLETIYKRVDLQEDIALMIRNYIEVVRRDIVDDQQLIEICDKIYSKHQKALDLIFENKTEGGNPWTKSIREAIKDCDDVKEGVLKSDRIFVFYTDRMNEFLGKLTNGYSSWGDSYPYRYWISLKDEKLIGYFELGGYNVSEEVSEKQRMITKLLKQDDNRGDAFRYKRLYRTKPYSIKEDDTEEEVKEKVEAIIKSLLTMEENLFKNI